MHVDGVVTAAVAYSNVRRSSEFSCCRSWVGVTGCTESTSVCWPLITEREMKAGRLIVTVYWSPGAARQLAGRSRITGRPSRSYDADASRKAATGTRMIARGLATARRLASTICHDGKDHQRWTRFRQLWLTPTRRESSAAVIAAFINYCDAYSPADTTMIARKELLREITAG